VLILFGGGLSMADGIASTKLAEWIGLQVKLLQFAPIVVIIFLVALFAIALSEVTSNTATAAMIIPILSAVAVGTGQNPLLFTVPATIAVSCPFMLPVATPPNAIVFGTGYITIPQMVKSGFWRDCIAVVFSVIVTYLCLIPFFDISLGVMPSWVASK
jgi:sodium-dependent dicarboxylate transporter 2/3/5